MVLKKRISAYLMIFPALIIVMLFVYWPSLNAAYYSLTDWNGSTDAVFIGLSNYIEMFKDTVLLKAFTNILITFVLSLICLPVMAILVAELIHHVKQSKWSRFYQVMFVLPLMVPSVITLYVGAQVVMDSEYGLLNTFLRLFTENTPNWLGDSSLALYSVFMLGFPFAHGIFILMILAGLQSISPSILESAKIEGVTVWKRFWLIDLPLIKPQVGMVVTLIIIWVMQSFTAQIALTKGGPGYATTTPAYELYTDALSYSKFGYSYAIGVVLCAIILVFTLLNLSRNKDLTSG